MMWSGNLLNNISSLLSFLIVCFSFHVFLLLGGFLKKINERKALKQKKRVAFFLFPPLFLKLGVKGLVRVQTQHMFESFSVQNIFLIIIF